MAEPMRMSAEVVDKFSNPLKSLRDQLRQVRSPAGIGALSRDFQGIGNAALNASRVIRSSLNSALLGLGLSAAGATGAIAAFTSALRGFSGNVQELRELSKETGLTVQQLRVLEAAAPRFAIGTDQMRGGVERFAQTLHDFRRRRGTAYEALLGGGAGGLAEALVQSARKGDTGKALATVMDYLAKERARNPQNAARLAELLFGSGLFARLGREDWKKILGETNAAIPELTPDQEKRSLAFKEALDKISASFKGLKETGVSEIAGPVTELLDRLNKSIAENREGIVQGIRDFGKTLESINWQRVADDIKSVGGAFGVILDLMRQLKEWNDWFASSPIMQQLFVPKTREQLDAKKLEELRSRKSGIENWLAENPDAPKHLIEGRRRGLAQVEAEIRRLEGAVEKGTEKGVQKALENQQSKMGSAMDLMNASAGLGGGSGAEAAAAGVGGGARFGRGGVTPAGRAAHAIRNGGTNRGAAALPDGGTSAGPLLDEISRAEGTFKRGYNDSFAHQVPGTLTDKTLNEIQQIQARMRGSSAIGRYQFMRKTLRDLMQQHGLTGEEKFTPELQDRLARSLLNRRGYGAWKAGRISDTEFMRRLSYEWAGLTNPTTGRGSYPGQTTGHSVASQQAALEAERQFSPNGNGAAASRGPLPLWLQKGYAPPLQPGQAYQASRAAEAASPYGTLQQHRMDITLNGFPAGWQARAQMSPMFRETNVSRGRNMSTAAADE